MVTHMNGQGLPFYFYKNKEKSRHEGKPIKARPKVTRVSSHCPTFDVLSHFTLRIATL